MDRSENYEGQPSKKPTEALLEPYKFYLVDQLSKEAREKLDYQCSSLFLNCIDFDYTDTTEAAKAFDLLYNIYCKKFVHIDKGQELLDEREQTGVYRLINKIQEENPESKKMKS